MRLRGLALHLCRSLPSRGRAGCCRAGEAGARWGGRGCRSAPYARRPSRQRPGWARGPRVRKADRDAAARRDHRQAPAQGHPAQDQARPDQAQAPAQGHPAQDEGRSDQAQAPVQGRPDRAPAQVLGGPARAPVLGQARGSGLGGELGPGQAWGRGWAVGGWLVGGWDDRWDGRDGFFARLLLGNTSLGIATRRRIRLAGGWLLRRALGPPGNLLGRLGGRLTAGFVRVWTVLAPARLVRVPRCGHVRVSRWVECRILHLFAEAAIETLRHGKTLVNLGSLCAKSAGHRQDEDIPYASPRAPNQPSPTPPRRTPYKRKRTPHRRDVRPKTDPPEARSHARP